MEYDTMPKEQIRSKIRECVSIMENPYSNDYKEFPYVLDNLETDFLKHYKAKGGLFVRCTPQNVVSLVVRFLREKKYQNVFNGYEPLNSCLKEANIPYQRASEQNSTADISIYGATILLASEGSMVFIDSKSEQKLYDPNSLNHNNTDNNYVEVESIYGYAPIILVLAQKNSILPDLKTAYQYYTQYKNVTPDYMEIVSPKPNPLATEHTVSNPLFILFLIS